MEHTKGNWEAHGFKVTGQAGLTYVADCYPFIERVTRPKLFEAKANARLISAAPDLYEACKEVEDWVEKVRGGWEPTAFTKLSKAIAKAEGK